MFDKVLNTFLGYVPEETLFYMLRYIQPSIGVVQGFTDFKHNTCLYTAAHARHMPFLNFNLTMLMKRNREKVFESRLALL